jgi:retron-type reverse transcriptase
MEEVIQPSNLKTALRRVRQTKGSPGIDGMTVDELPSWLMVHWQLLREQLLAGRYQPSPVRR